jgi:hypothetical protein
MNEDTTQCKQILDSIYYDTDFQDQDIKQTDTLQNVDNTDIKPIITRKITPIKLNITSTDTTKDDEILQSLDKVILANKSVGKRKNTEDTFISKRKLNIKIKPPTHSSQKAVEYLEIYEDKPDTENEHFEHTHVPTDIHTLVPTSVPKRVPTPVPASLLSSIPTSVPTIMPTYVNIPKIVSVCAPTSVPAAISTNSPTYSSVNSKDKYFDDGIFTHKWDSDLFTNPRSIFLGDPIYDTKLLNCTMCTTVGKYVKLQGINIPLNTKRYIMLEWTDYEQIKAYIDMFVYTDFITDIIVAKFPENDIIFICTLIQRCKSTILNTFNAENLNELDIAKIIASTRIISIKKIFYKIKFAYFNCFLKLGEIFDKMRITKTNLLDIINAEKISRKLNQVISNVKNITNTACEKLETVCSSFPANQHADMILLSKEIINALIKNTQDYLESVEFT